MCCIIQSEKCCMWKVFDYKSQIRHCRDQNGKYWFSANDIAKILEMSNIRVNCQLIPEDKKQYFTVPTKYGDKQTTFVDIDTALQWIARSRKPNAVFQVINKIFVYIQQRSVALKDIQRNNTQDEQSKMDVWDRVLTKKQFENDLRKKYNGKTVAYIVDVDISLPQEEKVIIIDTSTHFDEHMIEYHRNYPYSKVFYSEEFDVDHIEEVNEMIDKVFDGFYVSYGIYEINIDLAKDMLSSIVKNISEKYKTS